MANRRYLQLDVFAPRPGTGNPLGVVLDADDMDATEMQALAAWLNLSETIFFMSPREGADYRIRIFTPGSELPFAGHPSVGGAWAAVAHGLSMPRDGKLVQDCEAGLLPVQIEMDGDTPRIAVRSPRARKLLERATPLPAGLAPIARAGQPAELWNNGPSWWLVEAESPGLLHEFQPDFAAIAAWTNATSATGVAIFAHEKASGHDLTVRAFCPGDAVNIPEDPVTGSANAVIAAWLHQQGRLPGRGNTYVASQGRALGRDGRVSVRVDAQGEVWIGGQVQPIIEGRLDW